MAGFGISGGGSTSNQVGNTSYQQISPTSDPTFAKLLAQIQAITPTALPGINDIVSGGMNSPLLQLVLGPMLQRLQAPQAQARQNLTEQTRAAGGLRGSTYGQDMNKLVANQGQQQNDLMASVLQQVLGQLISGSLQSQQNSMLPTNSLTNLLRTITPQTVTGAGATSSSSGWGSIPPSLGLAAPMAGDSGGSSWDQLQRALYPTGGGATVGVNTPPTQPGGGIGGAAGTKPYSPYLDPLSGVSGGGSFDLGMGAGTQWLGGGSPGGTVYKPPAPEWNPITGAYQGGYGQAGGPVDMPVVTEGWW